MTKLRVKDVMTTPMLTLEAETSITEAADAMRKATIKSVVVVGEGCRPAGIFTSTDALSVIADNIPADETAVQEYMTTGVETVSPDVALTAAAEQMHDGGYSHLPVTDADDDGVGILTKTDLAEAVSDPTTDTSVTTVNE
ncbi:CBS domain-containing protein [Haloquadratum walsbyi]|uniref:Putative signal-transduction protein containing cAMP-binding and CBS domain protein n=1 Tax=Haloquadratum walsbyi J07HQW2 TaxID=1238425 RepID=U1NGD4_9EURY|nr:CBS domain-containing protein [Haloquadratum walsbyi]ERG96190.1 MAG: putative signal-transduction protein containing cAMP-binding and CBS domain protein [Haloquadratum walsbyi J07HQW2]